MSGLTVSSIPLQIRGLGKAVTNAGGLSSRGLEAALDLPEGCLYAESGVHNRYISPSSELPSELIYRAFRLALLSAKLQASDVDFVLLSKYPGIVSQGTCVTELAQALGLREGVPVMEVGTSGANALSTLTVALGLLRLSGPGCTCAVIASEQLSTEINKENWRNVAAMGEGAAALILSSDPAQHGSLRHLTLKTSLSAHSLHAVNNDGEVGSPLTTAATLFNPDFVAPEPRIEHRNVLSHAIHQDVAQSIQTELARLRPNGLKGLLVVPHQGSRNVLDWVHRTFEPRGATVVDILEQFGNQGTASTLFALAHAFDEGLFSVHEEVLLLAQSAGLTGGSCLIALNPTKD